MTYLYVIKSEEEMSFVIGVATSAGNAAKMALQYFEDNGDKGDKEYTELKHEIQNGWYSSAYGEHSGVAIVKYHPNVCRS